MLVIFEQLLRDSAIRFSVQEGKSFHRYWPYTNVPATKCHVDAIQYSIALPYLAGTCHMG